MVTFLSNIGDSLAIRELVSQTDIHNTTITLVLDQIRTLKVQTKIFGRDGLTVRCHDTDQRASILLHLPFQEGAIASATIVNHTTESTGA